MNDGDDLDRLRFGFNDNFLYNDLFFFLLFFFFFLFSRFSPIGGFMTPSEDPRRKIRRVLTAE